MVFNHAPAIMRWRDQLDDLGVGFEDQQTATISTMLFGCDRWLDDHISTASTSDLDRIRAIKEELEGWLLSRGIAYVG